jgi:hypothetical protein
MTPSLHPVLGTILSTRELRKLMFCGHSAVIQASPPAQPDHDSIVKALEEAVLHRDLLLYGTVFIQYEFDGTRIRAKRIDPRDVDFRSAPHEEKTLFRSIY